tara:strand:+ start:29681 stop:30556 length:876 start_codon:yes stop_codon:yes gene_type:complete
MNEHAWQRIDSNRSLPQRVLILGSSGMVGRAWCEHLKSLGIEYTAAHRPHFDLCRPETFEKTFDGTYDLVVNAAAWTDVDGAESDEQGALLANAYAVEQISAHCASVQAMLITYSTDYVFDGMACTPYPIDAPISPINAYGRSKALGESLLRRTNENHLLIRTSWVHAPWGKNFALTMRSLIADRDEIRVVNDQRGRPSSAISIAEGALDLYMNGASGTWHLTDSGECTWHGFAMEIRDALGSACSVEPCTSEEFVRPARRPAFSTLSIHQTEKLIGPRPAWQSRVRESVV